MSTPYTPGVSTPSAGPHGKQRRIKSEWTAMEDAQLMIAVTQHEGRWAHISSVFNGRSPADCLARYERIKADPLVQRRIEELAQAQKQQQQQQTAETTAPTTRKSTRSSRQSPVKLSQLPPASSSSSAANTTGFLDFLNDPSLNALFPGLGAASEIPPSSPLFVWNAEEASQTPKLSSPDSEKSKTYACPNLMCDKVYTLRQSYRYHVRHCQHDGNGMKPGAKPFVPKKKIAPRPPASSSTNDLDFLFSDGNLGTTANLALPAVATPAVNGDLEQFDFDQLFNLSMSAPGPQLRSASNMRTSMIGSTPMPSNTVVPLQQQLLPPQNPQAQQIGHYATRQSFHLQQQQQQLYRQQQNQQPISSQQRRPQPIPQHMLIGSSPAFVSGNSAHNQFLSSMASSPNHFAGPLNSVLQTQQQSSSNALVPKTKLARDGISRVELDYLFEDYLIGAPKGELEALIQSTLEEPDWAWSQSQVFSKAQLSLLKSQMNSNFQLVSQAFVIERELHGPGADEALYWEDQLRNLDALRVWGNKAVGPTTYHNTTAISKLDNILNLPHPLRTAPRSAASRDFVKFMSYQVTEAEANDRMYRSRQKKEDYALTTKRVAPMFEGLIKLGELCRLTWNKDLVPHIIRYRKRKNEFLNQEDSLLMRGITVFGVNDLHGIRAHCLPAKSVKAIDERIKFLSGRTKSTEKVVDNPVKTWLLKPFKPVTVFEKDIMRQAIIQQGPSALVYFMKIFPHHPVRLIKAVWQSMRTHGDVQEPFPSETYNMIMEQADRLSPTTSGVEDDDAEYSDDDDDDDEDDDVETDEEDVFGFFNTDACEEDSDEDGDFDPGQDDDDDVKPAEKRQRMRRSPNGQTDEGEKPGGEDERVLEVEESKQTKDDGEAEGPVSEKPPRKRKSVATRLKPAEMENVNVENTWTSNGTKKDPRAKLRKLSLAVQQGNSSIGRGRGATRGKKKVGVMTPDYKGDGTSPFPLDDDLFKKPHPMPQRVSKSPSNMPELARSSVSIASSSRFDNFEILPSSEPDWGLDFGNGGGLFDMNPNFRDGAMNHHHALQTNSNQEPIMVHNSADDELEFLLDQADDALKATIPYIDPDLDFLFSDIVFPEDVTPAATTIAAPKTPSAPIISLSENKNVQNQFSANNLLSSPLVQKNGDSRISSGTLNPFSSTPFAAGPSKLKDELKVRSHENTVERNRGGDENSYPEIRSDGKIQPRLRKRSEQDDDFINRSSNVKKLKANVVDKESDGLGVKKMRRGDMALAAALAGKNSKLGVL